MSERRAVILVGAGHVHLNIAARAESFVECGVRLVLIDATAFWYSGLATGMLGGEYQPVEDQVDPKALIEAQAASLSRTGGPAWTLPGDGCTRREVEPGN